MPDDPARPHASADSVAQGRFSMTSMDVPADRPVASLPLKD
jgi:hypothetical protein